MSDIAGIYNRYLDKQEITADEAAFLHTEASIRGRADAELGALIFLLERLSKEYAKGRRCVVCCEVDNPRCGPEC